MDQLLEGQGEESRCSCFSVVLAGRKWECYVNPDHSYLLLEWVAEYSESGDPENGPSLEVDYLPEVRGSGMGIGCTLLEVKDVITHYLSDEVDDLYDKYIEVAQKYERNDLDARTYLRAKSEWESAKVAFEKLGKEVNT